MTIGTDEATCSPRHECETPPNSHIPDCYLLLFNKKFSTALMESNWKPVDWQSYIRNAKQTRHLLLINQLWCYCYYYSCYSHVKLKTKRMRLLTTLGILELEKFYPELFNNITKIMYCVEIRTHFSVIENCYCDV